MKKIKLLFLSLFFAFTSYSQSHVYFRSGVNYSRFKFKEKSSESINLNSDSGNSLGVGFIFPLKSNENVVSNNFHYELGFQYDNFDAYVESPFPEVTYKTQFLGLNNAILISIFNQEDKRFKLDFKAGLHFNKFISGKQTILNKIYDLKDFPEFNSIYFNGIIGVQSKYVLSEIAELSFGYDRYVNFLNFGTSTRENLSISSNQFKLGINLKINQINKK